MKTLRECTITELKQRRWAYRFLYVSFIILNGILLGSLVHGYFYSVWQILGVAVVFLFDCGLVGVLMAECSNITTNIWVRFVTVGDDDHPTSMPMS